MKLSHASLARAARRALVVTVVLSLIIPPAPAHGWKSNAHVYLAEIARLDALDGTITLPRYDPDTGQPTGEELGPYPVDPRILLALQQCPDQFRAGALGPDAYPDIATGQMITHPNNLRQWQTIIGATASSDWINALWNAVPLASIPAASSTCTSELAETAFATGYLTHAAGDMYGHTFINYFAGGAFKIPDNALQHVIIEGYVDNLIPVDETPDFYNISIDGATDLINDVLVRQMPGMTLPFHVTDNMVNWISVPRFFNGVRLLPDSWLSNYQNIVARYQELIDDTLQKANNCSLTNLSCSRKALLAQAATLQAMKTTFEKNSALPKAYMQSWREDIDDGLYKWSILNHEIAKSMLFGPEGGRPEDKNLSTKIRDYLVLELVPMTPIPDFGGPIMRILFSIGYPDFMNQMLLWKDNVVDYIMDYDLYGGITLRKLTQLPLNSTALFDIVVDMGKGPRIYRQQFRSGTLHMPIESDAVAFNAIAQDPLVQAYLTQANQSSGEEQIIYLLAALDRASMLENALPASVKERLSLEELDYHQIPAMRNTIAMDKLIFISRAGMDQLLQDIGYRCATTSVPVPIMLGNFMGSLDESDQGLDPTARTPAGALVRPSGGDARLLMGLARDPVAYRTVLQLQEGHSPTVLGYLTQNATQCSTDPQYQACSAATLTAIATYSPGTNALVNDLQFKGGTLYLASSNAGLQLLNPSLLLGGGNPLMGRQPLRESFYGQNLLVVKGAPAESANDTMDVVYLSDGQQGLIAVDVTNPTNPQEVLDYQRSTEGVFNSYMTDTYGIVKSGSRLYVSAGYNGVVIFDISNPPEIEEIDTLIPPGRLIQNRVEEDFNVLDVDLLDSNTLIVTTSRYLMAFDIDPAAYSPILLAYHQLPETAFRTTLFDQRAYVADGRGGLEIYDLAQVRSGAGIRRLGGVAVQGLVSDVAVKDAAVAYLTTGSLLYRVDTSLPDRLTLSCPQQIPARRIVFHDGYLYIGADGALNVFSPGTP